MKALAIILFDPEPVKVDVRPPQSSILAIAGAPWPKYHDICLPWIRLLGCLPHPARQSKVFHKHILHHLESLNINF